MYWMFLLVGEASKQIHEYKLKLQKAEQDITNLDGTVSAGWGAGNKKEGRGTRKRGGEQEKGVLST
jgi:hypothetical protein